MGRGDSLVGWAYEVRRYKYVEGTSVLGGRYLVS